MAEMTSESGSSGGGFDLSQFYQVFFEEAGENLDNMEQLLLNVDIRCAAGTPVAAVALQQPRIAVVGQVQLQIVANAQAYTTLATQVAGGNVPDIVGPVGTAGRLGVGLFAGLLGALPVRGNGVCAVTAGSNARQIAQQSRLRDNCKWID